MAVETVIPKWIDMQLHFLAYQQHLQMGLTWQSITSGVWTESELLVLNSNFNTFALASLQAVVANTVQILDYTTTDRNPGGTAQSILALSNTFGVVPGEILPLHTTEVVSWKTGLRGRSYRGRSYMPPTTEGDSANAVFGTAYLLLLTGFTQKVLAFSNSGGRSVHSAVKSATQVTVTPSFSEIHDNIPDSQRRRLQGRGR